MGELLAAYDIIAAFKITILLTVLSAVGSLVIGTVIAIFRVSPIGFLNKLGAFYVNTIRNTPLTLIIVFCNIGLFVNLGLRLAMTAAGIETVVTSVGDRYVLEAMRTGGYSLGGEQSGHIILAEHATTGDGILTALQLAARCGAHKMTGRAAYEGQLTAAEL